MSLISVDGLLGPKLLIYTDKIKSYGCRYYINASPCPSSTKPCSLKFLSLFLSLNLNHGELHFLHLSDAVDQEFKGGEGRASRWRGPAVPGTGEGGGAHARMSKSLSRQRPISPHRPQIFRPRRRRGVRIRKRVPNVSDEES